MNENDYPNDQPFFTKSIAVLKKQEQIEKENS